MSLMNEKGNVIFMILGGFLAILLLPPIILYFFPYARILFQIIMVFVIYSTVRGYIGDGTMTLVVSGVLVYFLVFKYTAITASLWVFQLLLGMQFMSVIVWGIGTRMK